MKNLWKPFLQWQSWATAAGAALLALLFALFSGNRYAVFVDALSVLSAVLILFGMSSVRKDNGVLEWSTPTRMRRNFSVLRENAAQNGGEKLTLKVIARPALYGGILDAAVLILALIAGPGTA